MFKTNKTEEQLYNRILINFGIGILAYGLLDILYQRLYMKDVITFSLAGLFLVTAVVFYVLSKTKPLKNYAHMFVAFCLALLFTRLSVIVTTFIGMNRFLALQENYILKKFLQTRTEVIIVVCLGAIYLVGMVIYNGILMGKAKEAARLERKANKKKK